MTRTIAVLSSDKSQNFTALKEYFKDKEVEITETDSLMEASEADLCVLDGYKGHLSAQFLECTTFISVHYSLLPAFDEENPMDAAFKLGVKVSGVTINHLNDDGTNGKIIAQYPVFIDTTTTFEEFEEEMYKVSQKLLPFVAESVLEDKIFSFGMLLKPHGCGGCGGCGSKN